jgi:hypothetical protein
MLTILRLHRTFDSFGNIVDETHYGADFSSPHAQHAA